MGLVTLGEGYLARSIIAHMLQNDYQVRMAVLQCGQYGLAQDRYRLTRA
jgi:site-specific DNA-cytosine methylase